VSAGYRPVGGEGYVADEPTALAVSEEAVNRLISVLAERRNELRPEHRRYLK
jgi:hypothetical protein